MKIISVTVWPVVAALTVFAMACTAPGSTVDAMPPPAPDTAPSSNPDVFQPAPEAGVERPSPPDAGPVDLPGEVKADAPTDGPLEAAPRPWPPPGTEYLTTLETEAEFRGLAGIRTAVPFIIRRRANDAVYPYPWDRYECVFEAGTAAHLEFLERMDPERALPLYYNDAKSPGGNLIPGHIGLRTTNNMKSAIVGVENFRGLTVPSSNVYFPLDAAAAQQIRERIKRCVPFVKDFTFSMICPDGSDCPLL